MCDERFEVCGLIEMSPLTVHSRTVRVTNTDSGQLTSTATAQPDGSFCVHCKPASYQFSVCRLFIYILIYSLLFYLFNYVFCYYYLFIFARHLYIAVALM